MGNFRLETTASESQPGQQQQPSSTHGLSEQSNLEAGQPHAVRFASVNQEIEPDRSLQSPASEKDAQNAPVAANGDANTKDDIRSLALNLQDTRLQESRLRHFAFEPVSLPASRVCTTPTSLNAGLV